MKNTCLIRLSLKESFSYFQRTYRRVFSDQRTRDLFFAFLSIIFRHFLHIFTTEDKLEGPREQFISISVNIETTD